MQIPHYICTIILPLFVIIKYLLIACVCVFRIARCICLSRLSVTTVEIEKQELYIVEHTAAMILQLISNVWQLLRVPLLFIFKDQVKYFKLIRLYISILYGHVLIEKPRIQWTCYFAGWFCSWCPNRIAHKWLCACAKRQVLIFKVPCYFLQEKKFGGLGNSSVNKLLF